MQIASQRMAERQQGLTDGEIGVAGGTAGAYGEEVSTEPGEEEVYLSDPGSSSNSTRDLRELRMVYVRYEVCSCTVCPCTVCSGTGCSCTVCSGAVCSGAVCSCTVCSGAVCSRTVRSCTVTRRSALRTSTPLSVAVQRSPLAVKRFH